MNSALSPRFGNWQNWQEVCDPFHMGWRYHSPWWRRLGKVGQSCDPRVSAVLVTGFDEVHSQGLFAFDGSELVEVNRVWFEDLAPTNGLRVSVSLAGARLPLSGVLRSRLTPD
jgi:hypothetical protein